MSNTKRPYEAPALTIEGSVEELTLAQVTGTHLDGFYQQPNGGPIVPNGQQDVGATALGVDRHAGRVEPTVGGQGGHVVQLRPDRLSWRELDGEIIALDVESALYFSANGAATLLLKRLVDGAAPGELVAALIDEFDVDTVQASQDVESFLVVLAEHGLVDGLAP